MNVQGDHSACAKPLVDFETKVSLWPGQARPSQAKAELWFCSQQEVLHKLNGHPVHWSPLIVRSAFCSVVIDLEYRVTLVVADMGLFDFDLDVPSFWIAAQPEFCQAPTGSVSVSGGMDV